MFHFSDLFYTRPADNIGQFSHIKQHLGLCKSVCCLYQIFSTRTFLFPLTRNLSNAVVVPCLQNLSALLCNDCDSMQGQKKVASVSYILDTPQIPPSAWPSCSRGQLFPKLGVGNAMTFFKHLHRKTVTCTSNSVLRSNFESASHFK